MPLIPFHPNLHQKVRYTGNRYLKFKHKLFVVHLKEHDLDNVGDEEFVFIHVLDKYGIVNYNKTDTSQPIYLAKKSELVRVGIDVTE